MIGESELLQVSGVCCGCVCRCVNVSMCVCACVDVCVGAQGCTCSKFHCTPTSLENGIFGTICRCAVQTHQDSHQSLYSLFYGNTNLTRCAQN